MTKCTVSSRKSCKTLPGKLIDMLRCECLYLTNFTLMLDVQQSDANPLSFKKSSLELDVRHR